MADIENTPWDYILGTRCIAKSAFDNNKWTITSDIKLMQKNNKLMIVELFCFKLRRFFYSCGLLSMGAECAHVIKCECAVLGNISFLSRRFKCD